MLLGKAGEYPCHLAQMAHALPILRERTVGALYSAWKLTWAAVLPQPNKALVNKWEGILSAKG